MAKIKRFAIDLSKCTGYVNGEHDEIIAKVLTKNKFFSQDYLYSVVDGNKSDRLAKNGTYRDNIIYAFSRDQLLWENPISNQGLERYVRQYSNPALAIWNRSQFDDHNSIEKAESSFAYQFKNPDKKQNSLIALVKLRIE